MHAIELLRLFTEELYKIYDELELKTLSECQFEGKNSAVFMTDIVRKKNNIHPFHYSDFKIHDELDFITKDIKYVSGVLHILQPFINNSYTDDGHYHQTLEDRRYLMYANFGLQSIYNFWDRLGDLLFLFFETGLSQNQVYFGRVMNNLKPNVKSLASYEQLKFIYEAGVEDTFTSRHEAVHHFQLECKHYWGSIEYRTDRDKLLLLNQEKQQYAALMKEQLSYAADGFYATLKLIDELPNNSENS